MKPLQTLNKANKTYLVLAVFAALIVLFYGNTLGHGFVMDDTGQIERNPYIRSLEYIPKAFTSCIWEGANKGCYGKSFYYRPVHYLSYLFTYQISSQAWVFHLVNLLYFFAVVFLVFLMAKLLTKNVLAAFFAGLIFLIHPINTEVVNWVSAVPELTFAMFVLLSTIFYVRYRQSASHKSLALVYVFYVLGILSKEPVILLPLALLSIDVFFFKFKLRELLGFSELKKYLAFIPLVLLYLGARQVVLGVGPQLGQFTIAERMHATVTLLATYIAKLFNPYPLSAFHEFQKSSDFGTLLFLGSFIALALFFAGLFISVKKQQYLLSVSLIWFLTFLIPVLVSLGGVGDNVFSERYLFVPAVGFVLAAGYLLAKAFSHSQKGKIAALALVFLLVVGSWLIVFPRNKVWKDTVTFYGTTLRENPNAHVLRRELGAEYIRMGEFEKARAEFEYLIEKAPDWKDITMAYKGLGDYYRARGDIEEALAYYLKAAETGHSARDYVPHNDVGVIYMERGEYLKGFSYFCQSLGLFSGDQAVQANFQEALALLDEKYIQKGIVYEKIREEFDKSPDEKIVYQDKRCEKESCQYAFSFQAQQFEVLPPFLITAAAADGGEVEITNKSFNPQTGVIILELDSKHKDQTLTFLFPACQGVYYEAIANPQ